MRNPVVRFLFVIWYLTIFSGLTIAGGLVTTLVGCFSARAARYITNGPWARAALWPGFIRLQVFGRENLPPDQGGYIMFVNHCSMVDIPVISLSTGKSVTWVAKASLAKIPFFGWALVKGHMLVDRGGGASAARTMVDEAAQRLKGGEILAIFPEGTRNRGEAPLLPFKKGTFILAKHTGAALVPVAVKNAGRLWPAGRAYPIPGVIRVKIGPPLAPAPAENLGGLTDRAHAALLAMMTDESW